MLSGTMDGVPRRRLKALVITTEGSDRQKHIMDLFSHPSMVATFEPPAFSPSVSSRALRNRFEFFKLAEEAGILPAAEWEAIEVAHKSGIYEKHPDKFFDCLKDIPVTEGRRGSKADVKLHYSCELWFKAKTINRGRSVLACTFAHLIALKRFVAEDFDVMLEDNVRAPVDCCAELITKAQEASEGLQKERGVECHFRLIGWLGSRTNLEYLIHTHSRKRAFSTQTDISKPVGVFPFPRFRWLASDMEQISLTDNDTSNRVESSGGQNDRNDKSGDNKYSKPGGNFIWGSYAYWISETAYLRLLTTVRNDVGSMLWKNKRARYYSVKPIDKILPRQIMTLCGEDSVQIATNPAFFRAPMLSSKIHVKWDPEFCKSTEYELENTGLGWSDLWLTNAEKDAVTRRLERGTWSPV